MYMVFDRMKNSCRLSSARWPCSEKSSIFADHVLRRCVTNRVTEIFCHSAVRRWQSPLYSPFVLFFHLSIVPPTNNLPQNRALGGIRFTNPAAPDLPIGDTLSKSVLNLNMDCYRFSTTLFFIGRYLLVRILLLYWKMQSYDILISFHTELNHVVMRSFDIYNSKLE